MCSRERPVTSRVRQVTSRDNPVMSVGRDNAEMSDMIGGGTSVSYCCISTTEGVLVAEVTSLASLTGSAPTGLPDELVWPDNCNKSGTIVRSS